jgi:hypothetical protein
MNLISIHVGLLADKMAMGQVYLLTFCLPVSFIIPPLLHICLSFTAVIIGPLAAEVPVDLV